MSHAVFCSVLMGIDKVFLLVVVDVISIHAPLAGCDQRRPGCPRAFHSFNPRTPCGVRHLHQDAGNADKRISIHAPLVGCDGNRPPPRAGKGHFNPRTPCGVRRGRARTTMTSCYFNPRTPCGVRPTFGISTQWQLYFNPRTPCGVRQFCQCRQRVYVSISIHAPLAGCDA